MFFLFILRGNELVCELCFFIVLYVNEVEGDLNKEENWDDEICNIKIGKFCKM